MLNCILRSRTNERGAAVVMALVIGAALIAVASVSMTTGRSDTLISSNSQNHAKALWVAGAGAENAKEWLEFNPRHDTWPVTVGPSAFGDGTFEYEIDAYDWDLDGTIYDADGRSSDMAFEIIATGTAPDNAWSRITEVVRIPGRDVDLATVNIRGAGTHVRIEPPGAAMDPPYYSIDGRNHDQFGNRSNVCSPVTAVRGSSGNLNTDMATTIAAIKKAVVKRANQACNGANYSSSANCTYGLHWVNGSDTGGTAKKRFSDANSCADCATANNCAGPQGTSVCDPTREDNMPCCYWNLDLSSPELRATGVSNNSPNPPEMTLPSDPLARGPFMFDTPTDLTDPPLLEVFTQQQITILNDAIDVILDHAVDSPISQRGCISADVNGGTLTFGDWIHPKIVIASATSHPDPRVVALSNAPPCNGVDNGGAKLDMTNGASITGTGILIIPRAMRLADASLHWRGIVLIADKGTLAVEDDASCGQVLGATLIADNSTSNNWKVDLKFLGESVCRNPFSFSTITPSPSCSDPRAFEQGCTYGFDFQYSCESVRRALGSSMQTIAWMETFRGE